MSIVEQIENIIGVAPEGYAHYTYAVACILLVLFCCLIFRFLMSLLGRH